MVRYFIVMLLIVFCHPMLGYADYQCGSTKDTVGYKCLKESQAQDRWSQCLSQTQYKSKRGCPGDLKCCPPIEAQTNVEKSIEAWIRSNEMENGVAIFFIASMAFIIAFIVVFIRSWRKRTGKGYRFTFSKKKYQFPLICACCSEPTNSYKGYAHTRTTGKKVQRSKTWVLSIPTCQFCKDHSSLWSKRFLALKITLGLNAYYLFLGDLSYIRNAIILMVAYLLSVGIYCFIAFKSMNKMKPSCCTVDDAIIFNDIYGHDKTILIKNNYFYLNLDENRQDPNGRIIKYSH